MNPRNEILIDTTAASTSTFAIPAKLIKEAKKRVKKATDQAKKLGLAWEPSLEIGKPYWETRKNGGAVQRVEVTLSYEPLALDEKWRLIARANILNAGKRGRSADEARDERLNVVISAARGISVPADAWNVGNSCDHCEVLRWRHTVYILECTAESAGKYERGDVVRVGSTCVEAFLGAGVIKLIEAFEALVGWGETTAEKTKRGGYEEKPHCVIVDLLACALMHAQEFEYASARSSEPTHRHALTSYDMAYRQGLAVQNLVTDEVAEEAMVISDWITDGMELSNRYTRNLREVFASYALVY
jgi:hypothetical protein